MGSRATLNSPRGGFAGELARGADPVSANLGADLQSLLTSERPDLVGNPYKGVGSSGSKVDTASCWFNPSAFALPPPGQFGNAGRNILRGPGFAQFDLSLQKSFPLREGMKIAVGAEAYNLLNHPNFAIPSNTQSPLTPGGNGGAVFRDVAGHFADNVGRIFTTVGRAPNSIRRTLPIMASR